MTAKAGDNNGIDPEREKIFFFHRRKYVAALAAKKAADAAIKNVGKGIKGDLGEFGLDEIKDYELALTAEGQERLKARSEGIMRSLRLAGVPVGTQLDLLDNPAPLDERAYRDGKEAGMRGDSLANPYNEASEPGQAFSKGWHEGQEAIFAIEKIKESEASGEELIKAEPKKPGRPKKAKAGSPLDGPTPDDAKKAANQNGAPPKPISDEELTNAEREAARQAEAAFH